MRKAQTPQGRWDGNIYYFAPTAYEVARAQQERQRERAHLAWRKRVRRDDAAAQESGDD